MAQHKQTITCCQSTLGHASKQPNTCTDVAVVESIPNLCRIDVESKPNRNCDTHLSCSRLDTIQDASHATSSRHANRQAYNALFRFNGPDADSPRIGDGQPADHFISDGPRAGEPLPVSIIMACHSKRSG
jgi:hypothetical protein